MPRRLLPCLLLACLSILRAQAPVDVLVQGAMDSELQPLLAALEDKRLLHHHAWTFWTGRIGAQRVAISRTEVGPVNAAISTTLGIQLFQPKVIISQGTAGGTHPGVALHDILIGERTTDFGAIRTLHADAGQGTQPARWTPMTQPLRLDPHVTPQRIPSFAGDPALIASFLALKNPRGRVRKANIGSAHQFNKELDRLAWNRQTFGIDSEDMESAFSAAAAHAFGVPFVAIRIISNNEHTHPQFEEVAGQYCAEFVLAWLVSRARQ